LEYVLAERKENKENKNQIRTLIKTYFPERDCHTLVRPSIDESKLQFLENLPIEDLRSEFIQQTSDLRNKLFSQIQPKCFKGIRLNGEMFCNMIK
jgi:Guanylate-binding protein, N-terminal domain